MTRLLFAAAAVSFLIPAAAAQELPRFDAASVRPHRSADDVIFAIDFHEGGRLTAIGSLELLVRAAYRLQEFQLEGAFGWMRDEPFAIVARGALNASRAEMRLMLRTLLQERFALTIRRESRDMPVYALRTGRAARVRPAARDCGPAACAIQFAPGVLRARGVTMPLLASELTMWTDRVVVDETGASGLFDVDLDWTPDVVPQAPLAPGSLDPPLASRRDAPSIFTAVREQLGLVLEPARGEVEVFVIERAVRPVAD